jgi:membrane protein YqaA with SNARE-associated domain
MEHWFMNALAAALAWLALPSVGLPGVFVLALLSATLLPMGSEPAVAALVLARPELFWPAVMVATLGNTLGGGVSWWMGRGAGRLASQWQARSAHARALVWLSRLGPKACLLAWLPVVGDPLCAVAGWLRLPFWHCLAYMAVGKFARYAIMTSLALGVRQHIT